MFNFTNSAIFNGAVVDFSVASGRVRFLVNGGDAYVEGLTTAQRVGIIRWVKAQFAVVQKIAVEKDSMLTFQALEGDKAGDLRVRAYHAAATKIVVLPNGKLLYYWEPPKYRRSRMDSRLVLEFYGCECVARIE